MMSICPPAPSASPYPCDSTLRTLSSMSAESNSAAPLGIYIDSLPSNVLYPNGGGTEPSAFHNPWTGQPASLWETVGFSRRRKTRPVTKLLSAWAIAWKTVRTCSAEESRRNFHVKLERRS